jgi:hypothetical protein
MQARKFERQTHGRVQEGGARQSLLLSDTPSARAQRINGLGGAEKRRPIVSKFLVVANQTLGGDHLMDEVRRRAAAGPCSFHVVVPNTRSSDAARASGAAVAPATASASEEEEHRATLISQSRLHEALARLRAEGLDAQGDVGDPEPLTAIGDALAVEQFDEIIISTLPSGLSRWLGMDLPSRAERKFKLPVTTVTARH